MKEKGVEGLFFSKDGTKERGITEVLDPLTEAGRNNRGDFSL